MRVSGDGGELRVGYQTAARLGEWSIEPGPEPGVFTFVGAVTHRHDVYGDAEVVDLALALGAMEWRWPGVRPIRNGDVVTVELTARPQTGERAVTFEGETR